MSHTLWTIGHSTKPSENFLALLKAHHIQQLVDVRTIPRSRHNPQFNREILSTSLKGNGVGYTHRPQLGGLRKPKKDSINTGWRNESFRGYADYMQTEEFWDALGELIAYSQGLRTAIMCAEAVPWRCHRSLIADAMLTRDWQVRHIMRKLKSTSISSRLSRKWRMDCSVTPILMLPLGCSPSRSSNSEHMHIDNCHVCTLTI